MLKIELQDDGIKIQVLDAEYWNLCRNNFEVLETQLRMAVANGIFVIQSIEDIKRKLDEAGMEWNWEKWSEMPVHKVVAVMATVLGEERYQKLLKLMGIQEELFEERKSGEAGEQNE